MQYVLNPYNRNISDEDLLQDMSNVARQLNKNTITIDEYNKLGKYSASTIIRRFGSWLKCLEKANLSTNGHNFICTYSEQDIKDDILRVLHLLKQETLTEKQYDKYGKYSGRTLGKKYNGWNNVLKLCGLKIQYLHQISDVELFIEIERVWSKLGKQPTTSDIKSGVSQYSLNTYTRHFGGWRNTLISFINYVNQDSSDKSEDKDLTTFIIKSDKISKHKTTRDINLRLRFKVFQRDNFKCCICGASPAVDSSVQLHVDHIKPWSKGGETVLENLQTLCSKCNLGKSDLDTEN